MNLFEYSGSGRVRYVDCAEFDANFSLQMRQNGQINGVFRFSWKENNYFRLLECLRNSVPFSFRGKTRQDAEIETEEGTSNGYFESLYTK
jgi:hypothetical protein